MAAKADSVHYSDVLHGPLSLMQLHVCVPLCVFMHNPKPLRVEAFWVSPEILSEVQVIWRNGNKRAFLYWYSIDHSVPVASSYHPVVTGSAVHEHWC